MFDPEELNIVAEMARDFMNHQPHQVLTGKYLENIYMRVFQPNYDAVPYYRRHKPYTPTPGMDLNFNHYNPIQIYQFDQNH